MASAFPHHAAQVSLQAHQHPVLQVADGGRRLAGLCVSGRVPAGLRITARTAISFASSNGPTTDGCRSRKRLYRSVRLPYAKVAEGVISFSGESAQAPRSNVATRRPTRCKLTRGRRAQDCVREPLRAGTLRARNAGFSLLR